MPSRKSREDEAPVVDGADGPAHDKSRKLKSSSNRRRGRRLFAVLAIRDIVSSFRKMSTKSDQAHWLNEPFVGARLPPEAKQAVQI